MEKILHENSEKILKSNIEILFGNLNDAIKKYIDDGEWMGELKYINAYLSATIHAIVCYIDKLIEVGRMEETEVVQALKYVNNLQKHNPNFVSITKRTGGFVFPMSFPFSCEMYDVVWSECIGLTTKKPTQKVAYEKLFQDRKILDILDVIVKKLLNDSIDRNLD